MRCAEVVIKLKQPPLHLFQGHDYEDKIYIRIQPNPSLNISIDIKSPGLEDKVQTQQSCRISIRQRMQVMVMSNYYMTPSMEINHTLFTPKRF